MPTKRIDETKQPLATRFHGKEVTVYWNGDHVTGTLHASHEKYVRVVADKLHTNVPDNCVAVYYIDRTAILAIRVVERKADQ